MDKEKREYEIILLREELRRAELGLIIMPRMASDLRVDQRPEIAKQVKTAITQSTNQIVKIAEKLVQYGVPIHIDTGMFDPMIREVLEIAIMKSKLMKNKELGAQKKLFKKQMAFPTKKRRRKII